MGTTLLWHYSLGLYHQLLLHGSTYFGSTNTYYATTPYLLGHTEAHPPVVQADERRLAVVGEPPALVRFRGQG